MKGRFITAKVIAEFKEHLILEERSEITIEKYIRDVKAFSAYTQNAAVIKETVIAYKKHLQENYAVRSVNMQILTIRRLSRHHTSYLLPITYYLPKIPLLIIQSKSENVISNK